MLGLRIDIEHDLDGSSILEKLIAQCLDKDPAVAAAFKRLTAAHMNKIVQAALRVTGARTRKSILRVYDDNFYNWGAHKQYTNWLGGVGGAVVAAHLIRANRPIKALTKKGNKRKRGYSQRPINMPKPYQLGGRLKNATRYNVKGDVMEVGVLPTSTDKAKDKMYRFQDGSPVGVGSREASRRYLAALGMYYRRGTILRAEPRPLYENVANDFPPAKVFANAFSEMLLDKLRVGD